MPHAPEPLPPYHKRADGAEHKYRRFFFCPLMLGVCSTNIEKQKTTLTLLSPSLYGILTLL